MLKLCHISLVAHFEFHLQPPAEKHYFTAYVVGILFLSHAMKLKHGEHNRNLAYNIGGGIQSRVLGTWICEGIKLQREGQIGLNQLLMSIHPKYQGYQHVLEHIVTDH
jgi:hypothetical protein